MCRGKCTNTAGKVVPKLSDPHGPWGPLLVLQRTSGIDIVLLLVIIVGMLHLFSSLKNSCARLILKSLLLPGLPAGSAHDQIDSRKDCWCL